MNTAMIDKIVEAVLYEGYVLYPYRSSSVKNRHRWTFGGIYSKAYSEATGGSDPWMMQAACLIADSADPRLQLTVRFLQPTNRTTLPEGQTWQEAIERRIEIGAQRLIDLLKEPRVCPFSFAALQTNEPRGETEGSILREQRTLEGVATILGERIAEELFRVTVRVENLTPPGGTGVPPVRGTSKWRSPADCGACTVHGNPHGRDARATGMDRDIASLDSFASTHLILAAEAGRFVSLTDPPEALAAIAAQCQNIGCWPVLVGRPGERDTMLASPIILADYPEVAAESPGDLFDSTEIDEILSLRIMTLTDEEKRQAASTDDRVRGMLARTDALARDQLMSLHGTIRGLKAVQPMEQRHA